MVNKGGPNIGTFCIIDRAPRFIHTEQTEWLQELAPIVVDEMEIRLAARHALKKSLERELQSLRHATFD